MKVIALLFTSFLLVNGDDILCTSTYCDEYLEDNTCPDLTPRCRIQNDTHNGIFLPFAGPCNCCDYCIANADEGDACAIGNAASTIPLTICGDLLYCTLEESVTTCQRLVSECSDKQTDFDDRREAGTLGHLELRENCNRRGLYEPYKCIPGEICYCVNEKNERIFGEIPFTIIADFVMNCGCSRKYDEASAFLGRNLHQGEFLRCKSDGDYDPIQCLDDDNCFCVHADDGSLAINQYSAVNVTNISNETLSCFDHNMHIEGEYYRACEAKEREILKEIEEYESLGYEVFGYSFPNCQLDGYYAAVQENETSKYCADPDGNILGNYIIDIADALADTMDCKCARANYVTQIDEAACCRNGNYNPMQCRRGLCRCVDENGNQNEMEVNFADRATLSCSPGCADVTPLTEDSFILSKLKNVYHRITSIF